MSFQVPGVMDQWKGKIVRDNLERADRSQGIDDPKR